MAHGIERDVKEQYQREAAEMLIRETEFPVACQDDFIISVYVNDELGTFKTGLMGLDPYSIDIVHPLGSDDHFDAVAYLKADWTTVDEWGED